MIKKEKITKDNIVKFPSKLTDLEKEIEAVIFAAAEPLDIDTIESKITKKGSVAKTLEKLQTFSRLLTVKKRIPFSLCQSFQKMRLSQFIRRH